MSSLEMTMLDSASAPASFTVVIPALNEEAAVGGTIERTLRAADTIRQKTPIQIVNVVVVSDGSTDRTVEIARGFADVRVLVFEQNRGYGAAIKAGWDAAPADLLGFLDADGTCDPEFFVPMIRAVLDQGHDLVLGGRMGRGSKMPLIRTVGNTLFALLLGYLSRKRVRDTASGMRVVRRSALRHLLPLPDGLHFTPAMSARALMDDEVRIAELDMPYAERVGRSKLRVIRDGFRFLGVILGAAAYVRLSRLTLPLIAALLLACASLSAGPVAFYAAQYRLEEWMFYRLAMGGMLGTIAVSVLCATIVSEHVSALALMRYEGFAPRTRGLWRYGFLKSLLVLFTVVGAVALALNFSGFQEYFRAGQVHLHWSRVLFGALAGINFTTVAATLVMLKLIRAMHERQPFLGGFGAGRA